MKAVRLKQSAFPLLLVIVLLATISGCAAPAELPPAKEKGEIQRVVKVEADGLTVHYLRQSSWGEADFSEILADKDGFKSDFKKDFEQGLAKNGVSASDYSFSFDTATRSTLIRCDIDGAISLKDRNEYYAQFEWLLNPLGLDFIDDDFEESKKGLFWEGSIKGVPTTITIELPTIDSSVYEAWSHPIGHCHAHAWWSFGG